MFHVFMAHMGLYKKRVGVFPQIHQLIIRFPMNMAVWVSPQTHLVHNFTWCQAIPRCEENPYPNNAMVLTPIKTVMLYVNEKQ